MPESTLPPLNRAARIARLVEEARHLERQADALRTPWERLLVSYSADLRARRLEHNAGLLELCVSYGIETEERAHSALMQAGLTPAAATAIVARVEL